MLHVQQFIRTLQNPHLISTISRINSVSISNIYIQCSHTDRVPFHTAKRNIRQPNVAFIKNVISCGSKFISNHTDMLFIVIYMCTVHIIIYI